VILLDRIDPSSLPSESLISVVTLAELSAGPLLATGIEDRAIRQARLQAVETDFVSVPFDVDAARAFGRVAAALRRAGRKTAARTLDAMIAATALALDIPLFTCNPADFRGIDELEVVAIPHPSA
jgi:tRNA(fMet)-specific endonuclease VapC